MEAQTPGEPRRTKKTMFWKSPGGDSDLAPESEIFAFFGFFGVCWFSSCLGLHRKASFYLVKPMFCLEQQAFAQ